MGVAWWCLYEGCVHVCVRGKGGGNYGLKDEGCTCYHAPHISQASCFLGLQVWLYHLPAAVTAGPSLEPAPGARLETRLPGFII